MESHDYAKRSLGKGRSEINRVSSCVAETTKDLALDDGSHKMSHVILRSCERSLGTLGMNDALERGKRAIDACDDLFFSENFKQMIKAGSHVAASHSESSRMNNTADFYA